MYFRESELFPVTKKVSEDEVNRPDARDLYVLAHNNVIQAACNPFYPAIHRQTYEGKRFSITRKKQEVCVCELWCECDDINVSIEKDVRLTIERREYNSLIRSQIQTFNSLSDWKTINDVDAYGNTALIIACLSPIPSSFVVELLLAKGADPFYVNKNGDNACDVAMHSENISILTVLIKHMQAIAPDAYLREISVKITKHSNKKLRKTFFGACVMLNPSIALRCLRENQMSSFELFVKLIKWTDEETANRIIFNARIELSLNNEKTLVQSDKDLRSAKLLTLFVANSEGSYSAESNSMFFTKHENNCMQRLFSITKQLPLELQSRLTNIITNRHPSARIPCALVNEAITILSI